MPKVSIIVPTYNRSDLIKDTIDSILNQQFSDFELIVVSNGSNDNTQDIVQSYGDNRVHFILQEGSGSPASPRNNGVRHAKGKYVAFCDDDDIWMQDKLSKQYEFMENNPEFGACYTKMKRFNDEGIWINPDDECVKITDSSSLLRKNSVPLSSLFVRKALVKEWFDEDKRIFGSEDFELILRISKLTKIHCIPEYLLHYNSGDARYSNSYSKSYFVRNLNFIKRIFWVYWKVYHKGFFQLNELFYPFLLYIANISRIILYNLKCKVLSK